MKISNKHFLSGSRNYPAMSDTLCISPWIHLHTLPNNKVLPCCMTSHHLDVGNLADSTLEEIWNNDQMKTLRKKMLNGEKSEICSRCYLQEKHSGNSNRTRLNEYNKDKQYLFDMTNEDGSLDQFKMYYWDFRFSNICNFKCRSCGPQLSSGWHSDSKIRFGKVGEDWFSSPQKIDLWEQIYPHFDYVEEIYFAGGEPLIMEQHYMILQELLDRKKTNVLLRYNTNLSKLNYKNINVLEYWNHFDTVEVWASLDSYLERGEYLRKGTVWSEIEDNIRAIKRECPHISLKISATVGIFNAYDLTDFIRHCINSGFIDDNGWMVNPIQTPEFMRIQVLPIKYKEELLVRFNSFIEETYLVGNVSITDRTNSIAQINHLKDYMMAEDRSHQLPELLEEIQIIDRIRNEDFFSVFPEYQDLFNDQ